MKKIFLLTIGLFYTLISFSQEKSIIDEGFFCRKSFSYGNAEYILANQEKKGFLLRVSNNFLVDTIITFKAEQSLSGFNILYIKKDRIYIVFDLIKELIINDSITFVSPKLINNIVCFDLNGKFLWRNFFQPEHSIYGAQDFKFISGCLDKIYLGFNVSCKVIVNKDTIGSQYFENRAIIMELNRKGSINKVVDFSNCYKSSRIYDFNRYRFKNLTLMLNYPKGITTTDKKIFKTNRRLNKIFIASDSLQITNIYIFHKQLYVFTWEGYLIKYKGKRPSNFVKLESIYIPELSKKASISQKTVFDNGEYFTYVCAYEVRDKEKKWNDWGSVEKLFLDIQHIKKDNMKVYKKDTTELTNIRNWATIISCKEEEIRIIKDGKYYMIKK